jgi:hypothetical protein
MGCGERPACARQTVAFFGHPRRRLRRSVTPMAALAVTPTWAGVPQDCWFDATLPGAQIFQARAQASLPERREGAGLAPLGRRGFTALVLCG